MKFTDIETLIGRTLPPSARRHRPWWSNNASNHVNTKAWLDAGYKTERVDLSAERLVFRKVDSRDSGKSSVIEDDPLAGLYGGLKGTVRLRLDVDLTLPVGEIWDAERT
jgi:hypothetical protein